jgi:hypothetical protein
LAWLEKIRSPTMATAFAALLGALSCDGHLSECNDLIGAINSEQGQLKELDADDPRALTQLSERLDAMIARLDGVALEAGELKLLRRDYEQMCRDLSDAASGVAKRLEDGKKDEAAAEARKLQEMGSRESRLVNSINAYCQGG